MTGLLGIDLQDLGGRWLCGSVIWSRALCSGAVNTLSARCLLVDSTYYTIERTSQAPIFRVDQQLLQQNLAEEQKVRKKYQTSQSRPKGRVYISSPHIYPARGPRLTPLIELRRAISHAPIRSIALHSWSRRVKQARHDVKR